MGWYDSAEADDASQLGENRIGMSFTEPSFTVGIEEEYLLVDPATGDVVREPPDEMLVECGKRLGNLVRPEFLRSQIEVGTGVCRTVP